MLQGLCTNESFDNEAHNLLGSVYMQLSEYAQAENCFRQALARQSANTYACYGLGMAVGARGNVNEASQYLKNRSKSTPTTRMPGSDWERYSRCWACTMKPSANTARP